MKKLVFAMMVLSVACVSCATKDKKKLIEGKWQGVTLESSKLDDLMKEQNAFLDTFGKNTTADENVKMYGFANIDSARQLLKQEMVDYMAMQDHAVKNTWFDFRKDGIVVMDFSGQKDSTKWHINEEGMLMLDEAGATSGEKIKMEILSLTDTMLKLEMTEQGMSSIVIFKPANK